jgi:hypothetical protein
MGKKNKKAKAGKLPKTIAGVKVPKELRDAGGMLSRIARDPAAREVALAALTAALAARKDNRKAARNVVAETGEAAKTAKSWLGPALAAAAVEAGRMLIDAVESGGNAGNNAGGRSGGANGKAAKAAAGDQEAPAGAAH